MWNRSNLSEIKHRISELFCRRYNHDSPIEFLCSSLSNKLLQLVGVGAILMDVAVTIISFSRLLFKEHNSLTFVDNCKSVLRIES